MAFRQGLADHIDETVYAVRDVCHMPPNGLAAMAPARIAAIGRRAPTRFPADSGVAGPGSISRLLGRTVL